jgi:hypothetical protein
MRTRDRLPRCTPILALLLLPWAVALAGDADTDGGEPTAGKQIRSGWNPTFVCDVEPGDTLDDVLECLADGIAPPPSNPCPPTTPDQPDAMGDDGSQHPVNVQMNVGGSDDDCSDPMDRSDFVVTRLPWPQHGIRILRIDEPWLDIDRLLLWENDPGIQMIDLKVNREGLVARIGEFVERPSRTGGIVTVTLNGRSVYLNTALFRKAPDLSSELERQLRDAHFEVRRMKPYLVVTQDLVNRSGITHLRLQSEDPGIATSDLALMPMDDVLAVDVVLETE